MEQPIYYCPYDRADLNIVATKYQIGYEKYQCTKCKVIWRIEEC